MQIHELNNFTGTLGSGAYLAIDDGNDTGKISSQGLLAATEARIDNIIAGPAPSAEEIVDARLGDDGVTYPSLGDAIRDQFSDVKSDINDTSIHYAWEQGALKTADGSETASNNCIRTSNYYIPSSDVYFDFPPGYRYQIYRYDASKNYINCSSWVYLPSKPDFGTGAYYKVLFSTNPVSAILPSAGENLNAYKGAYKTDVEKNAKNIAILTDKVVQNGLKADATIEGYSRTVNTTNLIPDATKKAGYYYTRTSDAAAAAWNYYTLTVTEGDVIRVKTYGNYQAAAYYLYDNDNNLIETYPEFYPVPGSEYDKTFVVPSGVTRVVVNENTEHELIIDRINSYKYIKSGFARQVEIAKSGNSLQLRTPFGNKVMALDMSVNGSQNGGFNFNNYVLLDEMPADGDSIATGTTFKGAGDDICPIHYNGSYRGANHGRAPVWLLTLASHGLTTADIGSVWQDANNRKYVIYKIDSTNTFSVIGDINNSVYDVNIYNPSQPLVHISGATHTSNLAFTARTNTQMLPSTKNKTLKITNDHGVELSSDGCISGDKYIQIDETYELFDIIDCVTKLKANVGNNDNDSYYDDSIKAEMLVQNSYRFFSDGACVVACNATPLKEGIYLEYWGGVQSGAIGTDIYVPFSSFDTIQTQGSSTINLDATAWRDADFPPYKMYQFDGNNGMAVGYCIDYGKGEPSVRKNKLSGTAGAGFYYGSSHKMYPHFYDVPINTDAEYYGNCLSFYTFKAPLVKTSSMAFVWYEIDDAVYAEIEFFSAHNGLVELPIHCIGKKATVVKKTDSVSVLTDIVSAKGVYIKTSGAGSLTLKCY